MTLLADMVYWINESTKPTLVLPDNKPVGEATDLMGRGKHSKNPRLQSFLALVNRSNVIFRRNSAKAEPGIDGGKSRILNRTATIML